MHWKVRAVGLVAPRSILLMSPWACWCCHENLSQPVGNVTCSNRAGPSHTSGLTASEVTDMTDPPSPAPPGPPPPGPPPPPASKGDDPRPGGHRGVPAWVLAAVGVAALVFGVVIGLAVADPDEAAVATSDETESETSRRNEPERTTTTTTPRTTTTERVTTTTEPEEGSRENPFDLGTPLITTDGLEVMVDSVNFEAEAAIMDANSFNDPPEPGMRYVLVNLSIANSGDEPTIPWLAITLEAIGSQNRVHGRCGQVIPDNLQDAPELYPGGTATGNLCVVVPEEEVADGSLLLMVSPGFGDAVFVQP